MILHGSLGSSSFKQRRQLKMLINKKEIALAGNLKLKIYGGLNCSSGKRMKVGNRVFFTSEAEALQMGFRPCGNCRNSAYKKWKAKQYIAV